MGELSLPESVTQLGSCGWVRVRLSPCMGPSHVLSCSYHLFIGPQQLAFWHFGSRACAFWSGAYGRYIPNKYFIESNAKNINSQPWHNWPRHLVFSEHGFSSFDGCLTCVSILFFIYQWLELSDRCGLFKRKQSVNSPKWSCTTNCGLPWV